MGVFDREMEMYQKVLPLLNKIGSIDFCPVVYVDNTEGQEALVLEHMKQFGWKDALNKKEGLRYMTQIVVILNLFSFCMNCSYTFSGINQLKNLHMGVILIGIQET